MAQPAVANDLAVVGDAGVTSDGAVPEDFAMTAPAKAHHGCAMSPGAASANATTWWLAMFVLAVGRVWGARKP